MSFYSRLDQFTCAVTLAFAYLMAPFSVSGQDMIPIDIEWSDLALADETSAGHSDFQSILDVAHTGNGGIVLYGLREKSETAVQVLNGQGGEFITVRPKGDVHYISGREDGSFFLAGSVKKTHGWPLSFEKSPSDAYLALFSRSGDMIWERNWGEGGFQIATDIATLPSEGAVVTVLDGTSVLLVAFDGDGNIYWTAPVGIKGAAVAVSRSGNRIFVVTLDNKGRDRRVKDYSEDLILTIRDLNGKEVHRAIVRSDLNRMAPASYLKVALEPILEGIAVASSWSFFDTNAAEFKPLEIATYDNFGQPRLLHLPSIGNCNARPLGSVCIQRISFSGEFCF